MHGFSEVLCLLILSKFVKNCDKSFLYGMFHLYFQGTMSLPVHFAVESLVIDFASLGVEVDFESWDQRRIELEKHIFRSDALAPRQKCKLLSIINAVEGRRIRSESDLIEVLKKLKPHMDVDFLERWARLVKIMVIRKQ
jgi:hypothetical protein